MKLELVTLTGVKVNQEVYEVMLPTAAGPISVFAGHEALVSVAIPGVISVRHAKGDPENKLEYFAISGGVIEISGERTRVLVDEADHGDDIVEAESKAALEKASQLIDRHQVRLNVAGIRRKRR